MKEEAENWEYLPGFAIFWKVFRKQILGNPGFWRILEFLESPQSIKQALTTAYFQLSVFVKILETLPEILTISNIIKSGQVMKKIYALAS